MKGNANHRLMARIAQVMATVIPHHVTQRDNRRLTTFFSDEDYQIYIALMPKWCRKCAVQGLANKATVA